MDNKEHNSTFDIEIKIKNEIWEVTCHQIPNVRNEYFLQNKRMLMVFINEQSNKGTDSTFIIHIAIPMNGVISQLIQEPIRKFVEILKSHGFNTRKVTKHAGLKEKFKTYLFEGPCFHKDFFEEKPEKKTKWLYYQPTAQKIVIS